MDERASKRLYCNRTAEQEMNEKNEPFHILSENSENKQPDHRIKRNQPSVTFDLSEQYEQPFFHSICENEEANNDQPLSLQEELKLSIDNTEIQKHMEDCLGN